MAKANNVSGGIFFIILIPIGAVILAILVNFLYDQYQQIILDRDTKQILTDLMDKQGLTTSEDYRNMALDMLKDYTDVYVEQKYTDPDNIIFIVGDDYVLFIHYKAFNDLRSIFNIFGQNPIDDEGYVDNATINKNMNKASALISSKYIARLNEYNEITIEKYEEDVNDDIEITSTTTVTA